MYNPRDASFEIAWLHYIGGLTQAEIAAQRGLSKATVHRLLKTAHDTGAVRVFVGGRPTETVEMEQAIAEKFSLMSCRLVPSAVSGQSIRDGVATLAAQQLLGLLDANDNLVIGLGAGRALSHMASVFPNVYKPNAEFVTLTGDFSVFREGHSTDVLRRLADRTGGSGYVIAAPIIANSEADRDVMISQEGTRIAFQKIKAAESAFVGIGNMGRGSFLTQFNLISEQELQTLRDLGVVADFAGTFLDSEGQVVDCPVGRRMLSCSLDSLADTRVFAVAYGAEKVAAIRAAVKSRRLTDLVSDFETAQSLLEQEI